MKDLNDYDLLVKYEDEQNKDKIYNEFYKRYKNFLKIQAYNIYKSVGKKLRIEFEDCEIDAMECLNNTIKWIDLKKFKGDINKFNLSYYIKLQVSAKINSYLYTTDKKKKKEVQYINIEFNNNNNTYNDYYKSKFEDEISFKDFHNKFNKTLTDKEIKIKRCLMAGYKDYKIKSILNVSNSEYLNLKEKIKENILTYGLYSINV